MLNKNYKIQAQDFGILALSNQEFIKIYDSAKISVISTGDEITDELIKDNSKTSLAVRDTNRPVLSALFRSINCQIYDGGIISDK